MEKETQFPAGEELELFDSLYQELLIDILNRLPIEDLVRCSSVCKKWYSLITNPNFISFHRNRTASASINSLLLVKCAHGEKQCSIHFDSETFEVYKSFDLPIIPCHIPNQRFRLIGCFNGVLCLSGDVFSYSEVIALWNPSIRKLVTLPAPLLTDKFYDHHAIGFRFCDLNNDYKVVRVVYQDYYIVPPEVEVYELSKGCWRVVDAKGFSYVIDTCTRQAYLNGAVHWIGHNRNREDGPFAVIVSFHMDDEVFGVIKVPDSVADYRWLGDFYVSVCGESLSLIHNTTNSGASSRICSVWVMKQYGVSESWMKQFTIDLTGGLWETIGFRKNGEALVVGRKWLGYDHFFSSFDMAFLFSMDSKSKQAKNLHVMGNRSSLIVENFVESLALLGVKGEPMRMTEKACNIAISKCSGALALETGSSSGKEDEDQNE